MQWRKVWREGIRRGRRINACSHAARDLFTRLILLVDDQGAIEADAFLIRSECFPRVDCTVAEVTEWMGELEENRLVARYSSNGDDFVYIPEFPRTQTFRTVVKPEVRCPAPTDGFAWKPCRHFDEYKAWITGQKPKSKLSQVGGEPDATAHQPCDTPSESAGFEAETPDPDDLTTDLQQPCNNPAALDQTRPEETRPEETRKDQTRPDRWGSVFSQDEDEMREACYDVGHANGHDPKLICAMALYIKGREDGEMPIKRPVAYLKRTLTEGIWSPPEWAWDEARELMSGR